MIMPPEDVKVLESVESQAVQDSLQSSSNSDESGSATPTTLVAQGR